MTVAVVEGRISADQLREVLARRDHRFPRRRAIARLAASGLDDREPLLRAVLQNREEHPLDRAIAAAGLAMVGTATALSAIAQEARAPDAAVLVRAVQILGRSGGAGERRALDDIARTPDARLAAQARFAAALIAHRHRLDLPGLPPVGDEFLPVADPEAAAIEVTPAAPEDVERCRRSLRIERFPFEVASNAAYRWRCLKRTMIVAVDPVFLQADAIRDLARRKALVAVVTTRVEDGDRDSVSHVVLASPAPGSGVRLQVCRMSGAVALAGEAAVADRVSFDLRAVRRTGAVAVVLRGSLGAEGLVLDSSRVARQVHARISPSAEIA